MIANMRTTLTRTAKPVSGQRSIWLLAFLGAVVAYVALLTHYESQIADVEMRIADIESIVSSDSLFARAQPHLIARRGSIEARLHSVLSNQPDDAAAIGAFLRDTHAIAQRNGVTVLTVGQVLNVAPTPVPVRPPAAGPASPPRVGTGLVTVPHGIVHARAAAGPRPFDSAFVAIPFNLKLTGGYSSLLHTIEQLSDSSVLVRVDGISLSSPAGVASTGLTADVRATVFRPTATAAALEGVSK